MRTNTVAPALGDGRNGGEAPARRVFSAGAVFQDEARRIHALVREP
jgi:hypothetical protein